MPPNLENHSPDPIHQPSEPAPEQPTVQPRVAERVIQPLDPTLTAPTTPIQPRPEVEQSAAATSTYDPTASTSRYTAPGSSADHSTENTSIKPVCVRHKSLMVLAILGLLSTIYLVYQAIQANNLIKHVAVTSRGSDQISLDVIYGVIVVDLIIYTYFLLAKDAHTVATILKVLLFFQVISVFGIFFGGSATRGFTFFVQGAYLLFTFLVYNVVKTPQAF
jgi:hypothetical protein